jgi:phosphopantothenoylcysteine decarboxylase/phosphopantothenate--cysteine ligase
MSGNFKDKHIVLGVCGGIAAYKSVELLRLLIKAGASVRVVMTANAAKFVGPLTFEVLSGKKVCTSLFDPHESAAIQHIQWAQEADGVILAPATANGIGKLAHGIADDALTTFMLAVTSPVMLCPSMNADMYAAEAVQANLDTLRRYGYHILEPEAGELACGTTGPGRLPEPAYILDRFACLLTPKDLTGRRILITAGPTRETIDPVRFISNPSSGKMGYALARAAEMRGAEVTLVTGPSALEPPFNVRMVRVTTAADMADAVLDRLPDTDVVIKSAAVADYRPVQAEVHKVKKTNGGQTLQLERTRDILETAGQRKTRQMLVGFAAETRNLDENAAAKLESKNLDMLVGNLIGSTGTGFEADTNQVTLYFKDGSREPLAMMPKADLAHIILDRVVKLLPIGQPEAKPS